MVRLIISRWRYRLMGLYLWFFCYEPLWSLRQHLHKRQCPYIHIHIMYNSRERLGGCKSLISRLFAYNFSVLKILATHLFWPSSRPLGLSWDDMEEGLIGRRVGWMELRLWRRIWAEIGGWKSYCLTLLILIKLAWLEHKLNNCSWREKTQNELFE